AGVAPAGGGLLELPGGSGPPPDLHPPGAVHRRLRPGDDGVRGRRAARRARSGMTRGRHMDFEAFAGRYGPWALVAGASEGVGACFAREVARRGVNVVLLARRQHVLDDLAAWIAGETGVEARPVAIDLAADDAMDRVVDATEGLDVGLLMYCAGADPNYSHFLGQPAATAKAMVHRNCVVPLEMCHHFAPA